MCISYARGGDLVAVKNLGESQIPYRHCVYCYSND